MSKRPKPKWVLVFYRAVGEFKDGERKMLSPPRITKRRFYTENAARKSVCAQWRPPFKAFVYKGRAPKRVTEIQINYPAE
jgi:hypothetical protein